MSIKEYREASNYSKSPRGGNIFTKKDKGDKSERSISKSNTKSGVNDQTSQYDDNNSDFTQNLNTNLLSFKKFEDLSK